MDDKGKRYSFDWTRSFSKHKHVEIEGWYESDWSEFTSWFGYRSDITRKTDHAGLDWKLEVGPAMLHFQVYDSRHWDYDHGDWKKYGCELIDFINQLRAEHKDGLADSYQFDEDDVTCQLCGQIPAKDDVNHCCWEKR